MNSVQLTTNQNSIVNAILNLIGSLDDSMRSVLMQQLSERIPNPDTVAQKKHTWDGYPISKDVMSMTFRHRRAVESNYKEILAEHRDDIFMRRLKGKSVFITGCNRGIGRVAIKKFAEEGANLYCAIRKENEEFNDYIGKLAEDNGIQASCLFFDLADEDSIKTAMKAFAKQKPKVDVLVNNAGVGAGGLMLMTPMRQIKEVFQINFFSQVLVTQHVAKLMMRQKHGSIINMSSVAGLDNYGGVFLYGSTKAAMSLFTKDCSNELAPFGIRCNAIAPGLIETDMGDEMTEKSREIMLDRSVMHRKGKPEEIANLMVFLASDESSYINGQIIRIDGGMV